MAEVARAVVVVKSTGAAELSVFQNAHARIGQPADFTFLRVMRRDFYYRAPDDFIRTEEAELDANNGLRIGAMGKSWHTWYLSWFFRQG